MFKRKRILIVSDYNPERISGMTIHINYLIQFWKNEKNHVLCQGKPTLKAIQKSEIIWFRSEKRFLKYCIWGLLFRKKMIYDLASFPWLELHYENRRQTRIMFSWIIFRIASKATLIRVLSYAMKNYLINKYHLQEENVRVFSIPVNLQTEEIRKRQDNRIYFIYVGSRRRWQGTVNLIKAFNQLESRNEFRLHCYGIEGMDTQNIRFHSSIPHDELIKIIIRDMDVVVIPREKNIITETVMPIKYLEAFYLKKYILATDLHVLHEVKGDQVIFIHDNRVDSIVQGINLIKKFFKESI